MTMNKRVELYRRLPEIYRIKDEGLSENYLHDGERIPAYQLRSYLEPVEGMFSAIHENIESLYHDFFIETCDEWVIPYIADLLGTSHLSGDEWTLRADVADTIALRRRKGTLGAIELLAFILTKWGVHSVELLENMAWNQHLNHQRPDESGAPSYGLSKVFRAAPIRGGTVNLRDPSLLAQLNTPFDPFAHVADVRPHETGQVRVNLPNLAIYLWRLKSYRLNVIKPHMRKVTPASGAARVVRVNIDPVPLNNLSNAYIKPANTPAGRPVILFNTNRYELFEQRRSGADKRNLAASAPRISSADQVPGPIPVERISDFDFAQQYDVSLASPTPQPFEVFAKASFTAPQEYVAVETYDETKADLSTLNILDVGLQLHIPESNFTNQNWPPHTGMPRNWTIRGENLCAWERGLSPELKDHEIAIDPVRGRICFGLGTSSKAATHVKADSDADELLQHLLLTFTYGAVGEVGAHPISYPALPKDFDHNLAPAVIYKTVNLRIGPKSLQDTLNDTLTAGKYPIVIEITDSRTHSLNIDLLSAAVLSDEGGLRSIKLNGPLIIRAADGERPIIELKQPFAFRPENVFNADPQVQLKFDAVMDAMFVRLEGLYIARELNYAANLPLVARAALKRLEILNCTLDPGGFRRFNGTRAPLLPGIKLVEPYGFATANDELEFKQTPIIVIQHSICGAIFTDEGYRLCITDSIIESIPVAVPLSGGGMRTDLFSITGASDPVNGYAAQTEIKNVTVMGRARTANIEGSGGIFRGVLEAFDQQSGCLKFSYFADDSASPIPPGVVKNRLPQNFACVTGKDARLVFTSEFFGHPGYCQLSLECDQRILEQGSGNDQMGAFNCLMEAHKWRNLRIRFREFMPVGARPLLIPIT